MASPEYVGRVIAENRAAMRQIGADFQAAMARQFVWTLATFVTIGGVGVVVACFI